MEAHRVCNAAPGIRRACGLAHRPQVPHGFHIPGILGPLPELLVGVGETWKCAFHVMVS